MLVIADLCNCEYTDHGHCGILDDAGDVDNDRTLDVLAKTALTYARAGVDVVAPSDMMDGRVAAIRTRARRRRLHQDRDHVVRGEVRLRVLRSVPRSGRVDAVVRRPPHVSDGSGQRARGAPRSARSTSTKAPTS